MQHLTFSEQIKNLFSTEMWNYVEQKELKFSCWYHRDKIFITLGKKPLKEYFLLPVDKIAKENYFKYEFIFLYNEDKNILDLSLKGDILFFSNLNKMSDVKILYSFLKKLNDVSKSIKDIYIEENLRNESNLRDLFYGEYKHTASFYSTSPEYVLFIKTTIREETCHNRVGKDNSFTNSKTVKYTIKMINEHLFSEKQKMIVEKLNEYLLKYKKTSFSTYYSFSYSDNTYSEDHIEFASLSRKITLLLRSDDEEKLDVQSRYERIMHDIEGEADVLLSKKETIFLRKYQIVLKTLIYLIMLDDNSNLNFPRYFWEDVKNFITPSPFPHPDFMNLGVYVDLPSVFEKAEWQDSLAAIFDFHNKNIEMIDKSLNSQFANFNEHILNQLILNHHYEYEFLSLPHIRKYIENLEKN